MDSCPFQHEVMRYHDGESLPQEHAHVEAHLRGCPECAAAIASFRAAGDMIRGIPALALGGGQRRRLDQIPARERDRTITTLAGSLTAAAAALFIAGALWLWTPVGPAPIRSALDWEFTALRTAAVEPAEDPQADLAAWIVADLTAGPRSRR